VEEFHAPSGALAAVVHLSHRSAVRVASHPPPHQPWHLDHEPLTSGGYKTQPLDCADRSLRACIIVFDDQVNIEHKAGPTSGSSGSEITEVAAEGIDAYIAVETVPDARVRTQRHHIITS